jgi:hypothetical protein
MWKEYWSSLQVGECVEQGNMQLFGLRHKMRPAIDYLTLERALKVGKGEEFRVDEVSVGGSVTDLKVHNGLDSPVLLVEGEILLGAKQNRTVYTTILVDKKSDIIIPVACVEQGRWSHRPAAKFALSDQYAHSSLRYAKLAFLGKARAESDQQRRRGVPGGEGATGRSDRVHLPARLLRHRGGDRRPPGRSRMLRSSRHDGEGLPAADSELYHRSDAPPGGLRTGEECRHAET